ncbi:stomatin-like protein 2, mitochondrial [Condylostylus longicornis]|uniref:stomatin-like protein 2, mitochondrial n=1 Tax=Condylostylus longicornis TaxID=2530218 RepID=UPI00244DA30B|nr:stomatin-like protein 2, mitochondrial [Condylostylus longicornis]
MLKITPLRSILRSLPNRRLSRAKYLENNFVPPEIGVPAVNNIITRTKVSTPINTIIMFVPQQEAWIIERMGKFSRILDPGLNFLVPIIDKIKYVQSLKEIAIDVPKQSAITSDNVTLSIDGVLYLRILDPYKASYGVEDPEFAITQLAQTTMRSELGKMSLDKVFRERESLNVSIVDSINKASEAWGITCLRYEIRDIRLPSRVHEAMQMQVEAERKKRAAILESEGIREADINVAEGKRKATILASEAERQEHINKASGEAAAILAIADAKARSLETIAKALNDINGKNAASLFIAEQYISAFSNLSKTNNTMILPANASDVTSLVGQAMTIYKMLSKVNGDNYVINNEKPAQTNFNVVADTAISSSNFMQKKDEDIEEIDTEKIISHKKDAKRK